jgi:hypothetical protein
MKSLQICRLPIETWFEDLITSLNTPEELVPASGKRFGLRTLYSAAARATANLPYHMRPTRTGEIPQSRAGKG